MQYVQGGTEIMIKRLLKSVREFKKDALLTPFFVVLEVVMEVIIPLVMALLIDKGIDGQDMAAIWKYGIILVLCAMLALMFGAAAGTFAARASTGFARNLRASFVQCCPITSQNLPDNTLPPYLPR